ncbi:DUF6172 family protein [Colwellia ponticola]|uniref:Uncharacterized protein n=1 Tax=Colwellia ponticola TaxID=2304625 RepID=A0A8H2JNZ8_9GAMM|nr:DUF6172 family protein [Colwellia ponticola]TMM47434.1 hypothetical protein FCS21_00085 [Colwellia ponticola]
MKKTFELTHPKIKLERRVDAVKHEVKKYLKRERNKKLPADADFWDFDCQFGNTKEEAEPVQLSDINKCIDKTQVDGLTSFYIEIIAKAGVRTFIERENDDSTFED